MTLQRAHPRCSRPLCSSQKTGGSRIVRQKCPRTWSVRGVQPNNCFPQPAGSVPQDPTTCTPPNTQPHTVPHPRRSRTEHKTFASKATVKVPPMSATHRHSLWRDLTSCSPCKQQGWHMLLRKEVIQPHLPVRLPCYDLVLITDPTFDGSLHKGWATGFGCYRLS
jgi:hypothetical protein